MGDDSAETAVELPLEDGSLPGKLAVPSAATGLVVFAHGSGSSRHSPRNNAVAKTLRDHGLATLLFDLLTEAEDRHRENRFDIPLLTDRLVRATEWVRSESPVDRASIGYFGSSTGAAAALRAAARAEPDVDAIVSRGGRVDMASSVLDRVTAPTLLVVGGDDESILTLNREAYDALSGERELWVVEGAGHRFEGSGELEAVAEAAADWFVTHLG